MGERTKIGVVHDLVEKRLIFAAAGGFVGIKKVVQPDGGGAERIRFDNIGAGVEILAMDLSDDLGLGQLEEFEASLQVLALPIAKAIAAIIGFGEVITLDHGAHGAIENDDAFLEEGFEGVERHWAGGELKRESCQIQGTN